MTVRTLRDERDFFSDRARLVLRIVRGTAHDLNLHRTAPRTYRIVRRWADARFGAT